MIALVGVQAESAEALGPCAPDGAAWDLKSCAPDTFEHELVPVRDTLDAIIIGQGASEPVQAVQRAHRLNPNVSVVVVGSLEDCARVRASLRLTPSVGLDVSCENLEQNALPGIIWRAAQRTRLRRSHRDALAALNLNLARVRAQPRRERYISQLVETAAIGVVELDSDLRIISANREALKLLAFPHRELLGRRFDELDAQWTGLVEAAVTDSRRSLLGRAGNGGWMEARAARLGNQQQASVLVVLWDVTARVRAEQAQQRLGERLRRLQDLTVALSAARTANEVAGALVRHGSEILLADSAALLSRGADGQLQTLARWPASQSEPKLTGGNSPTVPDGVQRALRTGRAEWSDSAAPAMRDWAGIVTGTTGPSALVLLPLVAAERVMGAALFCFDAPHTFDEETRSLSQTVAFQAGQALERAELFDQERAARQRLEGLAALAAALSSALRADDVSRIIVEQGTAMVGADTCSLYALDAAGENFELISDQGAWPGLVSSLRSISSNVPCYAQLRSGQALWLRAPEDCSQLLANFPSRLQDAFPRALWAVVPLVVEGAVVGLLMMGFHHSLRVSAEHRMFLETVAAHCAQALQRAQRLRGEELARAAAEKSSRWLETTLRSIGDAVIATDPRGAIVFMNAVAEALTGWSMTEAEGLSLHTVFRIVNEQTRAEVESPVTKVLREGVVVGLANHTILIDKHSMRETPIDDSGAPIRDEHGDIAGVVLVFRDVTEKKQEELRRELLAEATAALSMSLDYRVTLSRVADLLVPRVADAVAIHIVREGEFEPPIVQHGHLQNAALAEELRSPLQIDLEDARAAALPARDSGQVVKDLETDLLSRAAEKQVERLRRHGSGSACGIRLRARGATFGSVTVVREGSRRSFTGEDLSFLHELCRRTGIALDNAVLYESEQRARRDADVANRAKDEFLATVSHELRTPLNAILGWAKLLAQGGDANVARIKRALETIERNAVAMAQLIEDLLDVSRIVSGQMRLDLELVELREVIEQAIESVSPAAIGKTIEVRAELPKGSQPVFGDAARIQQIVWNLLSNAVKFTPPGGRVGVTLCVQHSYAEISITDTGKGIEPAFLPHVFDPFRQADGSFARSHGGLGLGLAIARHLAEIHGGSIDVYSDGPGHGATFRVRLPIAGSQAARASPPARSATAALLKRLRVPRTLVGVHVLAVDDDADARQLVKDVLEQCGVRVTSAASAKEAMECMERTVPDLLLSDIGMPVEDGITLIRKIRALPAERGGRIPAAALTAYTRAEDRVKIMNAGYTLHISKPLDPAELVASISTLMKFVPKDS